MHGENSGAMADHDRLGRFTRGNNARQARQDRIALKFAELVAEYFPNGGMGTMDGVRLSLVAKHLDDAATLRDPLLRQRATRCAEYLLRKLTPPPTPAKPIPSLKDLGIG